MTRLLSLAFIALVAIGLALLPEASPARLAALGAHELLALPASPDTEETLADLVLRGKAVVRDEANVRHLRLALGGTALAPGAFGGSVDLDDHGIFRRSIVRGLREAAGKDLELEIVDRLGPTTLSATFQLSSSDTGMVLTYTENQNRSFLPVSVEKEWRAPSWLALIPPFIAILLAILFRKPILALFLGVFGGTFVLHHDAGEGVMSSTGNGVADFGKIFWGQASDPSRLYIVGFVVFMLAMVGVLTRAGGIRGLMDTISRFASSARSTLIAAYGMGLAIFFDDYANTILVGSTMRPLTDKFRISREKLAYIVDSTAAPVAGLSIFSTWVAYQVSMFSAQLPEAGLSPSEGYAVLLDTLPYRFYCIFALVLVAVLVVSGRDFGPMLRAERRARTTGELVRKDGQPMVGEGATELEASPEVRPRAIMAILPLSVFMAVTIGVIFFGGGGIAAFSDRSLFTMEGFSQVLSKGSGEHTLFYGSLAGLVVACLLSIGADITKEIPNAAWQTLRSMFIAFLILYLAWMMGEVCNQLGTASYLSVLLSSKLIPTTLPAVLFLLAGVVAFSTGSSWSTMAILIPLVVGLAFGLGEGTEVGGLVLMYMSIGAVLEGAIFGDHCSPISDTTVLSSISCASDHIDHVRTQAPYAIVAMAVAMVVGYLPCAMLGLNPWLAIALGSVLIVGIVYRFGKLTDPPVEATPAK